MSTTKASASRIPLKRLLVAGIGAVSVAVTTVPVARGQTVAGDPLRGKQLATACFACHGVDGNSPSPVNPKIGGQHEQYLFMALQAYLTGSRADSLMAGAVLNKSEQDLRDIAAYYASQPADLAGADAAAPPGGSPGGASGVTRFDHGERTAAFTSLVARAEAMAAASAPLGSQLCDIFNAGASADGDRDRDGVADRYDAAPDDQEEFAADINRDARWEVCNIAQLQAIGASSARLSRDYQLVRDLDGSEAADFRPIGDCGPTGNCMLALGEFGFAGVFDGQGHAIRKLTIKRPSASGIGLFGVLAETGVIMNIRLEAAQVSGRAGVGALIGSNFGVLFNSRASGAVSGALAIGGLVGGSGGLIYGSRFSGTVSGQQAVGGLVGDMTGAVYFSQADATVNGQRGIGGLVGLNTFGSVLGSSARGSVAGSNDIGGLVGVNTDAKIRQSFATTTVTAAGDNVGGLVGFNSLSTVRNSYATGAVSGADGVGGLAGRNNGAVNNSYAAGSVQAAGLAGGVVGIVVEGQQVGTYTTPGNPTPYGGVATDLTHLNGDATGWAPSRPPAVKLLDFFCDENRNGFIDPGEARSDNYIWEFRRGHYPVLRCAAGT